jgi:formylglycine-generating enzyme required for sulfatase activity
MKALLAHIAEPGMDIRLVFADVNSDVVAWSGGVQRPETSDSLDGRFTFRKGEVPRPAPPAPVAAVAPPGGPAGPAVQPAPAGPQVAVAAPPAPPAGRSFRDCTDCPEMVVVPSGSFTMGSPPGEQGRWDDEGPQHVVTISRPFAVGKFHVTRDQYAVFVRETAYTHSGCDWRPSFAQEGSHPVVCVSWDDANAYVNWLAKKTGKPYRLPSEAEWEYAARGRTSPGAYPRYWFGDDEKDLCRYGNGADQKARASHAVSAGWTIAPCNDGYAYTSPVGHYQPNAFGLYDMFGNAWQWTADCWHGKYDGAPRDGTAWTTGGGGGRVVRGGSWNYSPRNLRAAVRSRDAGTNNNGFRVARTLPP